MILQARGKQRPRGARTKQEPAAGEQQNSPAGPEPRCRSKSIFPRHITKGNVIVLTDINLNMYCNTKHISPCRKQLWGSEVKLITQLQGCPCCTVPSYTWAPLPALQPSTLLQSPSGTEADAAGRGRLPRCREAAGSQGGMLQAGSGTSRGTGSTASERSPSCPKPAVSAPAFNSYLSTVTFFIFPWI